jgi:hypothetical protein
MESVKVAVSEAGISSAPALASALAMVLDGAI